MPITAQAHLDTQRRAAESASMVLRGIGLNAVLAVVKIAGGIWGNTYALIADGAESLVDIVSSFLVWAGLRVAGRPPDDNHPYGHGKAEPLATLGVAIFVLAVAVWVAWSAMEQIKTPHGGPHWGTLPLLVVVVLSKTFFSRRMHSVGQEAGSNALGAEAWHHLSDAITSAAAFVGISIAVVGGAGYENADDWSALVAAVAIGYNGIRFLRTAVDDMMDTALTPVFESKVRFAASAVAGVQGIDKCRIRKSGLTHLVDIHVEVAPELTVRQGHEIAGAVKHALLDSAFRISDVTVHIEPHDVG